MVSFASLALTIWLIWRLEGDESDLFFLVAFATTLGAAVGTRGGLYAIESEERLREAEDLTKLLTINQRVLRHNLRNELSVALGFLDNIEAGDRSDETAADVRPIEAHLGTCSGRATGPGRSSRSGRTTTRSSSTWGRFSTTRSPGSWATTRTRRSSASSRTAA
ncbi:MAG: hypothetical protein ACOCQU_02560 [Halolamina sp.]